MNERFGDSHRSDGPKRLWRRLVRLLPVVLVLVLSNPTLARAADATTGGDATASIDVCSGSDTCDGNPSESGGSSGFRGVRGGGCATTMDTTGASPAVLILLGAALLFTRRFAERQGGEGT